jgi:hypothetical protein
MNTELIDLSELAEMYKCSRRHARDVIAKLVGFPELAPGSTPRHPRWLRVEIRAFLHRKTKKSPTNPSFNSARP